MRMWSLLVYILDNRTEHMKLGSQQIGHFYLQIFVYVPDKVCTLEGTLPAV